MNLRGYTFADLLLAVPATLLISAVALVAAAMTIAADAPEPSPTPAPQCSPAASVWAEHYAELLDPSETYDPTLGGLEVYFAALTEA